MGKVVKMNKLVEMLLKNNIPYLRLPTLDTEVGKFSMLLYPSKDDTYAIVSQFPEKTTLFDMMGLGEPGDEGYLPEWSATTELDNINRQEVFRRIKKHWDSKKGDKNEI